MLPDGYEFVFIDGMIECDAAPEIYNVFPGPYLCWYKTPTTRAVGKAHRLVSKVMEEQGPFDAVMGFSQVRSYTYLTQQDPKAQGWQGAALAASMILHHELSRPSQPPLFDVAIFISSPLPFSYSLDYGIDTRNYFGIKQSAPSRPGCCTTVPKHLYTPTAYLNSGQELANGTRESEIFYQMFHPSDSDIRISIPTAHIYGRKDIWRLHSRDVEELSRSEQACVFVHDYGHEIPRQYSEEICDTIETAVSRAGH